MWISDLGFRSWDLGCGNWRNWGNLDGNLHGNLDANLNGTKLGPKMASKMELKLGPDCDQINEHVFVTY